MALKSQTVEVTLNNYTLSYYKSKGYNIPTDGVQTYYIHNNKRIKNGIKTRIRTGTKIQVSVLDLPRHSEQLIELVCDKCEKSHTIKYRYYKEGKHLCQKCKVSRNFSFNKTMTIDALNKICHG